MLQEAPAVPGLIQTQEAIPLVILLIITIADRAGTPVAATTDRLRHPIVLPREAAAPLVIAEDPVVAQVVEEQEEGTKDRTRFPFG